MVAAAKFQPINELNRHNQLVFLRDPRSWEGGGWVEQWKVQIGQSMSAFGDGDTHLTIKLPLISPHIGKTHEVFFLIKS